MVAHSSGYIHVVYPEATIDETAYSLFKHKLTAYLEIPVNFDIFTNFLRSVSRYQKFFQLSFQCLDQTKYIRLEKAFAYEHDSKNKIGDKTIKKLFCEIDEEDLSASIDKERAVIAPDNFIFSQKSTKDFFELFQQEFPIQASNKGFMDDLRKFVHTIPHLPSANKHFSPSVPVILTTQYTRDEIIDNLSNLRKNSTTVDLAFYASRQMNSCDWSPFLKAAFERNPVSIDFFKDLDMEKIYSVLTCWPDESIYEGNGLAMPDEVVNYKRGEGLEKVITLINIAKSRHLDTQMEIQGKKVILKIEHQRYEFQVTKDLMIPQGLI
jgi:hypothetical protein